MLAAGTCLGYLALTAVLALARAQKREQSWLSCMNTSNKIVSAFHACITSFWAIYILCNTPETGMDRIHAQVPGVQTSAFVSPMGKACACACTTWLHQILHQPCARAASGMLPQCTRSHVCIPKKQNDQL